jgi:predicted phage terminase large subunit-like protein
LTDVLYNTEGADHNEVALSEMVMQHKPSSVLVEGVMGWKETAIRIRQNIEKRGYSKEFRIVRPRKQKHSRILNRSSFIKNHIYFRKDYLQFPQYAKFMRVLTSYLRIQEAGKMNKHDDAPDLLEMAGAYFEKNFSHLW